MGSGAVQQSSVLRPVSPAVHAAPQAPGARPVSLAALQALLAAGAKQSGTGVQSLALVHPPGRPGRRYTPWLLRLWGRAQPGAEHGEAPGKPHVQAHATAQRCGSSAAVPGAHASKCAALQLLPDAAGGCHHNSSRAVWGRPGGVLPGDGGGREAQCQGGVPGSSCGRKGGSRRIQGRVAARLCTHAAQRGQGPAACQMSDGAPAGMDASTASVGRLQCCTQPTWLLQLWGCRYDRVESGPVRVPLQRRAVCWDCQDVMLCNSNGQLGWVYGMGMGLFGSQGHEHVADPVCCS